MRRSTFAIALTSRCIGRPPIGVIDGKGGTVPGALLYHLRDLRVRNFKAVLDGIAAAVQRALQSDAVICMTCYFLGPPVSFVNDCLQLLDGESWLRHQLPVLPEPRSVRHVYLDPIRAMVELLASCLPCFYWAIDHLYPFWHFQFRSVSLERIAARRRNCTSRDE